MGGNIWPDQEMGPTHTCQWRAPPQKLISATPISEMLKNISFQVSPLWHDNWDQCVQMKAVAYNLRNWQRFLWLPRVQSSCINWQKIYQTLNKSPTTWFGCARQILWYFKVIIIRDMLEYNHKNNNIISINFSIEPVLYTWDVQGFIQEKNTFDNYLWKWLCMFI